MHNHDGITAPGGARAELARVLCSARRARGLTQEDLAKVLCFGSHSSISELEHARRIPHEATLAAYCCALHLDLDALLRLRRRALAEQAPSELADYLI